VHELLTYRPTGSAVSLELPELTTRFYTVRFPPNHPEQARFVSTVLSKEYLYKDFFHYFVTKPSGIKRCASSNCRRLLDRQSLGIQTNIVCILYHDLIDVITQQGNSVRVNVQFCLNDSCLPNWLQHITKSVDSFKPFHNLIWVEEAHQNIVKGAIPSSGWTIETIPPLNNL
jgi:hypothetical protein